MKLIVSGIHIKNDPDIEAYAKQKAQKLSKFYPNIEEIAVRLISENSHRGQESDFYCEITVHIPGRVLEIVDTEREMDKAIDKAVERMKRLIVKDKEKKISKNHKAAIAKKNR